MKKTISHTYRNLIKIVYSMFIEDPNHCIDKLSQDLLHLILQ